MNYDKWQQTIAKVGGLSLDPENPRLAPGTNVSSERDIIAALVIHEDVYSLAKNIAANGFFPSEPLVATRQSGRLIGFWSGKDKTKARLCVIHIDST